jgi:uncharacterized membrane protein
MGIAAGALLYRPAACVLFREGRSLFFPPRLHAKLGVPRGRCLSAIPTVEFLSWRKVLKTGQAPNQATKIKMIRSLLHGELIGVASSCSARDHGARRLDTIQNRPNIPPPPKGLPRLRDQA